MWGQVLKVFVWLEFALNSFTINSTTIVAFLKKPGSNLIQITSAYVNGLVTAIVNIAKIAPDAIGSVILTETSCLETNIA